MAFITAAELKRYPLPVTDKQWAMIDAFGAYQLDEVLDNATQAIKDYLERDIEIKTYVERYRGGGRNTLMLDNYPMVTLTSVVSVAPFGTTQTYGSDAFYVDYDASIIEWIKPYPYPYLYPTYPAYYDLETFYRDRHWVVTYTAGYATIPGPIKHATALQAIQMLQPLFRGGTNFQQIDLVENSNEQIVDLLERYKRKRIG